MSYEAYCQKLYEERLAEKAAAIERRERFKQSVIDRQNAAIKTPHSIIKKPVEVEDFIMPETLPNDVDQLKWLIFQNITMKQRTPERTKEADANIKLIKSALS